MAIFVDGFLFKTMLKPFGKHVNEAIALIVEQGEKIGKTAKNGLQCFKLKSWGYEYFAAIDKNGKGLKLTRKTNPTKKPKEIQSITIKPGYLKDFVIEDNVSTIIKPGKSVERIVSHHTHNDYVPESVTSRLYNFKTQKATIRNLTL